MVSALILLAVGLVLSGPVSAAGRGVDKQQHREPLPPAAVVTMFPVLTGGFIATGSDPATVVALLIASAVVVWRIRRVQLLRVQQTQSAVLAEFLGLCAGNLRAGVPMVEAMDHALSNVDSTGAVTAVLRTSARRARFGGGGPAVLIDATTPDLQRLGTVWETSERHGVPLVTLMEQMRTRIDTRERHRKATTAQLQGPQATAVILALLPLAGVLMGTAMGADPIGLLTGGGIGGLLLVSGVALVAAGFVMTQKILEGANPS